MKLKWSDLFGKDEITPNEPQEQWTAVLRSKSDDIRYTIDADGENGPCVSITIGLHLPVGVTAAFRLGGLDQHIEKLTKMRAILAQLVETPTGVHVEADAGSK